jgi:hypothetical protein
LSVLHEITLWSGVISSRNVRVNKVTYINRNQRDVPKNAKNFSFLMSFSRYSRPLIRRGFPMGLYGKPGLMHELLPKLHRPRFPVGGNVSNCPKLESFTDLIFVLSGTTAYWYVVAGRRSANVTTAVKSVSILNSSARGPSSHRVVFTGL